ncbi:M56 family metallopeptidase [Lewinella sp. W8]|uniref:M56 family metallopeptidase n=1 Tax=Lewinella sp. W8 TaxID=2528208 RepID=UPI0010683B6E|nr:M56 family metallopeptidase [Lewinella sp. W8]MTB51571.1 hypothetical protein [Lewinella sp. W8]
MKTDLVEFILRATLIWGALLAYYYVVLHRNDHWRLRRLFLLFAWAAGMLIPLLPALSVAPEMPTVRLFVPEGIGAVSSGPVAAAGSPATEWSVLPLLLLVYLLGAATVLARTLVQSWRVWQWTREGEKSTYGGVEVVRHAAIRSPFAGWGRVFLPAAGLGSTLENIALIHETAHLRQRHHYDTILMMIGRIIWWFHPLQWVFHRLLADLHEYEADAAVTQSVPVRTYGLHLLQSSLAPTGALGLFSSPLKKRITMMTKTKVRQPLRALSIGGLTLLLAVLVVACSDLTEDVLPKESTPVVEGFPNEEMMQLYAVPSGAEDVPGAIGGEDLLRLVYQNVKYPAEARAAGLTGAATATVTVGTRGEILDITTVRVQPEELEPNQYFVIVGYSDQPAKAAGLDNGLFSEEVIRTIKSIGKFSPVIVDGVPEPYQLQMGFRFTLE